MLKNGGITSRPTNLLWLKTKITAFAVTFVA